MYSQIGDPVNPMILFTTVAHETEVIACQRPVIVGSLSRHMDPTSIAPGHRVVSSRLQLDETRPDSTADRRRAARVLIVFGPVHGVWRLSKHQHRVCRCD
jgi:alkylated DNA nucleotide flippase Atl1